MTISILVPAAGCGSRAGSAGNKILAPLHGKPLLWHTLRALTSPAAFPPDLQPHQLIIAARRDEFPLIHPIFDDLAPHLPFAPQLVEGGATRQESVYNAVRAATGEWLMVHDAARPFASPQLLLRVIEAARECGAALAALPCPDTVKRAAPDGSIAATLDRSVLWLAQTPQIFRREILLSANEKATSEGFSGTDCASLVERLPNQRVQLVSGEASNFKVTYPADLERAHEMLNPSG